jgi:hypothetical protein
MPPNWFEGSACSEFFLLVFIEIFWEGATL